MFQRESGAPADLLEHRRLTWDTICVRSTTHDILLAGVGVNSTMGGGGGEVVICVDARPLEDNPRPLDTKTRLQFEEGNEGDGTENTMVIFSKVSMD